MQIARLAALAFASWAASTSLSQCQPSLIAEIRSDDSALDLAASSDLRFVAQGTTGLVIYQNLDTGPLRRLATLELGNAFAVEASGSTVFVASDLGTYAVDVSVPLAARVLDQIDQKGLLKWRDGLLYIPAGPEGLHIIDAADPSDLNLLSTIPTASPATDVAVSNGRCYLATSASGLLYDVTNPASPQLLASGLPTGSVRMTGTRVYVAVLNGFHSLLAEIDITNPSTPIFLSQTDLAGFPQEMTSDSGVLTVLSSYWGPGCDEADYSAVESFDVSGGAPPQSIAFYELPADVDAESCLAFEGQVLLGLRQSTPRLLALARTVNTLVEVSRTPDLTVPVAPLANVDGRLVSAEAVPWGYQRQATVSTLDLTQPSFPRRAAARVVSGYLQTPLLLATDGRIGAVTAQRMAGPSGPDCFPDFAGYLLALFDLGNPDAPAPLSDILVTGNEFHTPHTIALSGNLAFVSESDDIVGIARLRTFDLEDPTTPVALPPVQLLYEQRMTHLAGVADTLFARTVNGSLLAFDIAVPSNVHLLGEDLLDEPIQALCIAGGRVCFVTSAHVLQVYDATDPLDLQLLGSAALSHAVTQMQMHADLLLARSATGSSVISLRDPADPRVLKTLPGTDAAVLLSTDEIYTVSDGVGSLLRFADPVQLDLVATSEPSDTSMHTFIRDGLAFASELNGGLRILDISGASTPSAVGFYDTPDRSYETVVLDDNTRTLAFVADGSTGLLVLDVTDPASPTFVSSLTTSDLALAVAVEGNFAYLACRFEGLQIVDITNPAAPVLVGSVDTPGSAQSVTLDGQLAYVADGSGGVHVIDISNRSLPAIVGTYDTPHSARQVLIRGPVAYVPDRTTGLIALDISDPTDPRHISTLAGLGDARGITDFGHLAFVADFNGLVHMIDIADPLAMHLLQSVPTLGTARAITNDSGTLYLADGDAGLTILEARPCWYQPCPPDLNSDASLDFFDVQMFLNAWSDADGLADWNDDGQINFFDVQRYLIAFSEGCAF